jgi:hypothetical protein
MKTCPHCKKHRIIVFDSNNDYCEDCKLWFPAVEDKEKTDNKEIIGFLADDLWEIAKSLETDEHEQSEQLKRISSCLHDIQSNRDINWYCKMRKNIKIDSD